MESKVKTTLAEVNMKMKDMETIHLYHLTPKWKKLNAQRLMLEFLMDKQETYEF